MKCVGEAEDEEAEKKYEHLALGKPFEDPAVKKPKLDVQNKD